MYGDKKDKTIIYRGIRNRDAETIADIMSMPGVTHGLSSIPYTSESIVKSMIDDITNKHWIIAENEGKAIGFIYLNWPNGRWRRVSSLAMGVSDEFVSQGIGYGLLQRALQVGFDYLDFERIELVVYQDNISAISIYKKSGMVHEGKREEQVIRNGIYYDSYLMGITRSQYKQSVKTTNFNY
ncbi:GNAT family N-acetyltransferase [Photobacterium angustum]|uniref:N-acetyltransferase domain-containing protein n=1 Tax=Photobacterium angustum TaxID=661 RepID=A0A2S7VK27_PHOAN|nr:GNAT family N-acetyltransferase [Photobacterium angustum]PQJ62285.1 hypothetical protein BTO08_18775 [Photobacterium angustum]